MILKMEFDIPDNLDHVMNIYLGEEFFIVTAKESKLYSTALSWISYDKGVHWKLYKEEEEFQLIFNSFGSLFMINKYFDILIVE